MMFVKCGRELLLHPGGHVRGSEAVVRCAAELTGGFKSSALSLVLFAVVMVDK